MTFSAVGLLILLAATFTATPLLARDLPDLSRKEELLSRARNEFAKGVQAKDDAAIARPHFRRSAESFEQLRQLGVQNAELYRNMGNAWLLADELPRAIRSYHQGLALAPNHAELQACLEEARAQVIYPAGQALGRLETNDRPPWLPSFRSWWFVALGWLLYTAAWIGLARWYMTHQSSSLAWALIALLFGSGIGYFLWSELRQERDRIDRPIVIVAEDGLLLRSGDGETYSARYQAALHRGVEARMLFERGDWLQIELSNGEVGWVPRSAVLSPVWVIDSPPTHP